MPPTRLEMFLTRHAQTIETAFLSGIMAIAIALVCGLFAGAIPSNATASAAPLATTASAANKTATDPFTTYHGCAIVKAGNLLDRFNMSDMLKPTGTGHSCTVRYNDGGEFVLQVLHFSTEAEAAADYGNRYDQFGDAEKLPGLNDEWRNNAFGAYTRPDYGTVFAQYTIGVMREISGEFTVVTIMLRSGDPTEVTRQYAENKYYELENVS